MDSPYQVKPKTSKVLPSLQKNKLIHCPINPSLQTETVQPEVPTHKPEFPDLWVSLCSAIRNIKNLCKNPDQN